MVTTICFLEDPLQAIKEIRRILRPSGKVFIGMLDKDSPLGKLYEAKKKDSKFFKYADLYSVKQVLEWLKISGYLCITSCHVRSRYYYGIKTVRA